MPDILLKDETGVPVIYTGIQSITIPKDGGGTATFSFGTTEPTELWKQMNVFLDSSSSYAKYILSYEWGKLISSNIPNFGLWAMTSNEVIKVWDSGILLYEELNNTATRIYAKGYKWSNYITFDGGYLISASTGGSAFEENSGILFYNENTKTINQLYASAYGWNYYKIINSGVLISTSVANSGLVFFDIITNTTTNKYSYGWDWTNFENDPRGYIIHPKDAVFSRTLLWSNSEKTITELN